MLNKRSMYYIIQESIIELLKKFISFSLENVIKRERREIEREGKRICIKKEIFGLERGTSKRRERERDREEQSLHGG